MRLTDTIKSSEDLAQQYKDSSNLSARGAIYRFSVGDGWGPDVGFARMLELIPNEARVLEIGCGPATVWKRNLSRVPGGWRVLLTDLMPGMVAEAKAGLGDDSRFAVRPMDAQAIDLPGESSDAVVANHMLYHVEDRPRALAEFRRVLKPGGLLFAATNSESHCGKLRDLISEFVGEGLPFDGKMPFSLENGTEQLSPFFRDIRIDRRSNQLRVTEAQAVMEYVLSVGDARQRVTGKRLDELRAWVQREIDRFGAFVDATDAGCLLR